MGIWIRLIIVLFITGFYIEVPGHAFNCSRIAPSEEKEAGSVCILGTGNVVVIVIVSVLLTWRRRKFIVYRTMLN